MYLLDAPTTVKLGPPERVLSTTALLNLITRGLSDGFSIYFPSVSLISTGSKLFPNIDFSIYYTNVIVQGLNMPGYQVIINNTQTSSVTISISVNIELSFSGESDDLILNYGVVGVNSSTQTLVANKVTLSGIKFWKYNPEINITSNTPNFSVFIYLSRASSSVLFTQSGSLSYKPTKLMYIT